MRNVADQLHSARLGRLERGAHDVEAGCELAELSGARVGNTLRVVAGGDPVSGRGKARRRPRDGAGHGQADRDRRDQGDRAGGDQGTAQGIVEREPGGGVHHAAHGIVGLHAHGMGKVARTNEADDNDDCAERRAGHDQVGQQQSGAERTKPAAHGTINR